MREWELVSACVFITYCKVHNRSENVHMYTQYCVHVHIKWCMFVTAEDCNKFLNVNYNEKVTGMLKHTQVERMIPPY